MEAGVFRADIPARFRLVTTALTQLRNEVPDTIAKELKREFEITLDQVVDFNERVSTFLFLKNCTCSVLKYKKLSTIC